MSDSHGDEHFAIVLRIEKCRQCGNKELSLFIDDGAWIECRQCGNKGLRSIGLNSAVNAWNNQDVLDAKTHIAFADSEKRELSEAYVLHLQAHILETLKTEPSFRIRLTTLEDNGVARGWRLWCDQHGLDFGITMSDFGPDEGHWISFYKKK